MIAGLFIKFAYKHISAVPMTSLEDKPIKLPESFLKDDTIIYIDERSDASKSFIIDNWRAFEKVFSYLGFNFAFLQDIVSRISPEMLN